MSGGKGKRGPSGPLITTSDEDEEDDAPCPREGDEEEERLPTSTDTPSLSDAIVEVTTDSPSPVVSPSLADHDYDNVASPGASSTTSEPAYVRQPGFTHHAHTVVFNQKVKRKKPLFPVKGCRRREPTPPKCRPKREPLPMRMRALPQSFFQQPNRAHNVSPGASYPVLPPLCNRETGEDVADVRPITPPSDSEKATKVPKPPECKMTVANTDLLLRLFDGVEEKQTRSQIKRGRPRKVVPSLGNKMLSPGNDPYMVDCVSNKLFPQLSLEQASTKPTQNGSAPTLQLVVIREGDKSILLPSLNIEQNYPQMLSELVMHI